MLSQPELSCKAPPAPAARWFIRCLRAGLESWSLQLFKSYLDFGLFVVELDQSRCQCPMQPCKQSCQCNCKCSRCRGRWQPRCWPQRCGTAARLALCRTRLPGSPVRRGPSAASCTARSAALQRSRARRGPRCLRGTDGLRRLPKHRSCWGRGCSTPHALDMLHHLGCSAWEESNDEKWSSGDRPWDNRAMQTGRDLVPLQRLLRAARIGPGC